MLFNPAVAGCSSGPCRRLGDCDDFAMYLAAILLAQGFHDVYFSTRGRRLCGPVALFARVRRRLRERAAHRDLDVAFLARAVERAVDIRALIRGVRTAPVIQNSLK